MLTDISRLMRTAGASTSSMNRKCKVEEIDNEAFRQLVHLSVYGIITATNTALIGLRLGSRAAELVATEIRDIIYSHQSALARERLAITTAENILADIEAGDMSWLKYSPPEVKGRLLDILCFDYGPTFWDKYAFGHNSREKAIVVLLKLSQCWRDYEETVTRINSSGTKGNFNANRQRLRLRLRLRRLMRVYPALEIDVIEQRLEGKRAVPNQPVQIARHFKIAGAHYV